MVSVPACAHLQVYMCVCIYECTRVHVITLCMRGCMYGSVYTCGHKSLQVHVCMSVTWGLLPPHSTPGHILSISLSVQVDGAPGCLVADASMFLLLGATTQVTLLPGNRPCRLDPPAMLGSSEVEARGCLTTCPWFCSFSC